MSINDTPSAVALRIIKARSLSGMTQNELADKSGIAAPQISRYETGRSVPRPEILAKLASTLGVTFESLCYGDVEEAEVDISEVKRYPSDTADKVLLRLEEPGMREQLKALAKRSGRKTLTAEINAALIAHIANAGEASSPPQTLNLSESDLDKLAEKLAARLRG